MDGLLAMTGAQLTIAIFVAPGGLALFSSSWRPGCAGRNAKPASGDGALDGAEGDRTPDLPDAIRTLSQLSYGPRVEDCSPSNEKSSAQLTPQLWLLRLGAVRRWSCTRPAMRSDGR